MKTTSKENEDDLKKRQPKKSNNPYNSKLAFNLHSESYTICSALPIPGLFGVQMSEKYSDKGGSRYFDTFVLS